MRHSTLKGVIHYLLLILFLSAGTAFCALAEDCPCDPCPGGAFGCKDGCVSICYLEQNRCAARCVGGKAAKALSTVKMNKDDLYRSVTINKVSGNHVKSELEQLFGVKLALKSKPQKDSFTVRSANVNLDGILQALAKEGLALRIQ